MSIASFSTAIRAAHYAGDSARVLSLCAQLRDWAYGKSGRTWTEANQLAALWAGRNGGK